MSIGDPITQPIPPVGTAGPTYATQLVAFMAEVKARLEAHVPMASLLIGPLNMAGNGITNASTLGLSVASSTPASPVGSLQYYGGNLWFVSSGGAFALTNGPALDVTSVGGFTGDYGSPNPAQARFTDSTATYGFYDDFGTLAWAAVQARYFDIAAGASSTTRARLAFAGTPNVTYTLPDAVPAGTSLVTMTSAGLMKVDNAFSGGLTITGNVTFAGTVTASTVTATDVYLTTGRVRNLPPSAANSSADSGAPFYLLSADSRTWQQVGAGPGGGIEFPLQLDVGDTITSWTVYLKKDSNASTTFTGALLSKPNGATGSADVSFASTSANAPGETSITSGVVSNTLAAGNSYAILVVCDTTNVDKIRGISYTYKRVP